jgi:hypothetical protein
MSDNKLLDERKARSKQLEDMQQMHKDLLDKTKAVEDDNAQLEAKIKGLEDVLEVKAGKLDYILEQKEALFNKLQLAISENKELKLQSAKKNEQGKKKGLISSLFGYFQQDSYSSIDVSQGKVKKSEIEVNPKNLVKQFNNQQSFYSTHDAFDEITTQQPNSLQLPKLIETPKQSAKQEIEEPLHEVIEQKFKEEGYQNYQPEESEEAEEHNPEETEEHNSEEAEPNDEDADHDHEHNDAGVPLDDQSEDMLKMIRENFNILPE